MCECSDGLTLVLVLARALVLVLVPQLLGDVLLLQVEQPLLFLLQPAEAPSPERRVLVHQTLHSQLWLLGGDVALALPLGGVALLAVHILILEEESDEKRRRVQFRKQNSFFLPLFTVFTVVTIATRKWYMLGIRKWWPQWLDLLHKIVIIYDTR